MSSDLLSFEIPYDQIKGTDLSADELNLIYNGLKTQENGPYFEYDVNMEDPTPEYIDQKIREQIYQYEPRCAIDGIVIKDEITVFAGPDTSFYKKSQLHESDEVIVCNKQQGFYQIKTKHAIKKPTLQ